jgi:hypothetical protein
VHYASGKVQTVRLTNHLMGFICTGKKIPDGFVCIATTLWAGWPGAQIPIPAIDFYRFQKVNIGFVVHPAKFGNEWRYLSALPYALMV